MIRVFGLPPLTSQPQLSVIGCGEPSRPLIPMKMPAGDASRATQRAAAPPAPAGASSAGTSTHYLLLRSYTRASGAA